MSACLWNKGKAKEKAESRLLVRLATTADSHRQAPNVEAILCRVAAPCVAETSQKPDRGKWQGDVVKILPPSLWSAAKSFF